MAERDSMDSDDEGGSRNILSTLIKVDFTYITSTWLGRVKLLELIFVTLAGIILPSTIGFFFTRYSFFTFIVWTSFMYIFIDIMLHLTSLWLHLPKTCRSSAILIFPVSIGAVSFLIGSSLIASSVDILVGPRKNRSICSAVFGFVVMILFVIEAILHLQTTKDGEREEPRFLGERNSSLRNSGVQISMPVDRSNNDPPPYERTQNDPKGTYEGRFL